MGARDPEVRMRCILSAHPPRKMQNRCGRADNGNPNAITAAGRTAEDRAKKLQRQTHR